MYCSVEGDPLRWHCLSCAHSVVIVIVVFDSDSEEAAPPESLWSPAPAKPPKAVYKPPEL